MSNKEQIFVIDSVIFESDDIEVNMTGTITQGLLSYETQLVINHTQLNQVISQLQRMNSNEDVYANINSTMMYDDNILYNGDFSDLTYRNIDISFIENKQSIKEIRA